MKKGSSKKNTWASLLDNFVQKNIWYIFCIILLLALYLRFYHIEYTFSFGWDQARDSWVVRDILQGNFTLIGPRTGVGHMYLGPLYYYLLAPFYFFNNLDPMSSNYFNLLAVCINFIIMFFVTRYVFGKYAALFVIFAYAFSSYLIKIDQVPWNVTFMPGLAMLIFFSIIKIYEGKNRWVFVLWTLSGLSYHFHFSAVFIPIINIASLIFVTDRKKVLLYSLLSIPLYFVWFIPNIIHMLQAKGNEVVYKNFWSDYVIRFHFRFFLHRFPDGLIMFRTFFDHPISKFLAYVIPAIFMGLVIFEKDAKKRLIGYLLAVWLIVPLIGITLYGGPLSEYYLLFNAPMALCIIYILQEKAVKKLYVPAVVVLAIFWTFHFYENTKDFWIKPSSGGLVSQKAVAIDHIRQQDPIEYDEGDITAYLYTIWTQKNKHSP